LRVFDSRQGYYAMRFFTVEIRRYRQKDNLPY